MNNTHFEWQSEETDLLNEPSPQTAKGKNNKKVWLITGLILLTTVMILLGIRYVNQRQRQFEAALRQQVETSFALWRKAVQQKDQELFVHFLAPGDRLWQRDQKQLFTRDLIAGRDFLSLSRREDGHLGAAQVTISPDGQQATVFYERTYTSLAGPGLPVRLRHVVVFAQQDANWRQAPLDEDFWGDWSELKTDWLVVRYPARDADVAQRIGRQLELDLRAICQRESRPAQGPSAGCPQLKPFTLTMSTAPASLAALDTATGPLISGPNFEMPAPTLVGLPVDEQSFQAFYFGYTKRILQHVRSAVSSPLPLPEQVLRALCYNHPQIGPRLYQYDPSSGIWQEELRDRSFRFLESLPAQKGLLLDEIRFNRDLWRRTHLIQWQDGHEKLLLDQVTGEIPYQVVNLGRHDTPYLLLRQPTADLSTYRYYRLNLELCDQNGCDLVELPGMTLWSPDGHRTMIQIGSKLHLGDEHGQIQSLLGTGFNPIWLDSDQLIYVRFAPNRANLTTEAVLLSTATTEEKILFNSDDLASSAAVAAGDLFIKYVALSPADPLLLLINASGLHDYAGQYFIFTAQLPADLEEMAEVSISLQVQRTGAPGGEPSQITPAGYPPFYPSPDGRWLVITELIGHDPVTRSFLLHDLQQNQTATISSGDFVLPAQFPSLDWSANGRWLAIAAEGSFRLLAPKYGYEQLLPHDFDYCVLTRWSDRP